MSKKMSEILRGLMDDTGVSETALARITRIGQPVIHRMCSGETTNPKVMTLRPIANFFSVSISQLIGDEPLPNNRIPGTRGWTQIPLLQWTQVNSWLGGRNEINSIVLVSTDVAVSERTFAVVVKDTTMRPRFPEGMMLVVDPSYTPTDRDFAIIQLYDLDIPVFKQVFQDGKETYLKPLNPEFKTIEMRKNDRFLGTVVQARMDFQKAQTHTNSV